MVRATVELSEEHWNGTAPRTVVEGAPKVPGAQSSPKNTYEPSSLVLKVKRPSVRRRSASLNIARSSPADEEDCSVARLREVLRDLGAVIANRAVRQLEGEGRAQTGVDGGDAFTREGIADVA